MKSTKRIMSVLAVSAFIVLSGCGAAESENNAETVANVETEMQSETVTDTTGSEAAATTESYVQEVATFEWKTEAPDTHGLDPVKLDELHSLMKGSQALGMLTVKDGVIVDEFYNDGYDAQSTFAFHSCSKSVTGTLIGIAIEQGYIESVEEPISKYLPEVAGRDDKRKADITIEDLLTNTSGLDWDEWNSYDVWNQFRAAPDWVEFILGRDLIYEPGTHFTYSTGNTHLLSAILQSATGKTQLEYAKEVLLEPLGMESVTWGSDHRGITDGGNGIVMNLKDAARFGQMCLQNGQWQGETIVSAEWLKDSTTAKNGGYGDLNGSYGYQWWMREYDGYEIYYAYGFGGQYIFVVPELNLVNVITSNNPNQSYKAREYFTEYLLDAVE